MYLFGLHYTIILQFTVQKYKQNYYCVIAFIVRAIFKQNCNSLDLRKCFI